MAADALRNREDDTPRAVAPRRERPLTRPGSGAAHGRCGHETTAAGWPTAHEDDDRVEALGGQRVDRILQRRRQRLVHQSWGIGVGRAERTPAT